MRLRASIRHLAIVLCLAAGAVAGFRVPLRIVADGSTYVAMADSLWRDHDLVYTATDLARVRRLNAQLTPGGLTLPSGLFLVSLGNTYRYGKPLLYPALAAPWLAACGIRGFFVLNGLLLSATLLLGAFALASTLGFATALSTSIVVLAGSVLPAYLYWVDPLLLLSAFVAGAVAAYRLGRPAAAGIALACTTAVRFTYAPLLAAPLLAYYWQNRRGDAGRYLLAAVLTISGLTCLTAWLTGQWSPYTGERYWYPNPGAVPYAEAFDETARVLKSGLILVENWRLPSAVDVAQGFLYFLVGRASGLLLYFPAFLACSVWARERWTEKLLWVGAVAAVQLGLEVTVPHNPSGGAHALGNRFFIMLPVAFLFVDRLRRSWPRGLLTVLLLLPTYALLRQPEALALQPGRAMLDFPDRLFPFEWTHATAVSYPFRYPQNCMPPYCAAFALTDTQSVSPSPPGIRTPPGKRSNLVFIRPTGRPPTLLLSPLGPGVTIVDGDVTVASGTQTDNALSYQLAHPRASYRDESNAFRHFDVYELTITVPGVAATSPGEGVNQDGVLVRFIH